jgi:hypothetical protein
MNRKTIAKSLTALHVKDGDILCVQADDLQASNQLAQAITELRNQMKLPKCLVVVLNKGDKIDIADEEMMRRMGWQRVKR